MGNVLSNTNLPSTPGSISFFDRRADILLGIIWGGTFYVIGMIWFTIALIDRWRGPLGNRSTNFFSVIAAFILSMVWPVVMIFLCGSRR